MIHAARLRDRVPGILVALAFQAGLVLLLVFSFPVVERLTQERETILFLAPPAPPPIPPRAIVIDGRPRPPLRPSVLPPPLASAPRMLAPPPSSPPPPPVRNQLQPRDLARPPVPPAPPAAPDRNSIDLNPPSGVQDEKRWEAEMARKNTPPDAGVSVGVGVGVSISEPLCKLAWVFLGGGFKCNGPAPAHHDATDAQVDAAVAAANARHRALSDASVLMSAGKTGDAHAKDGTSGGPDGRGGTAAGGTANTGR